MSSRDLLSILACGAAAAALCHPGAAAAQSKEQGVVEEVVVTASKTGEDLRKVAGSVSAVTGDQLQKLGAQSAQDYLMRTPGVVFNAQQPGFSTITVRGVNTSTNSLNVSQGTTGVYINDVPLTDAYFSSGTPDVDTFDIDHVEVYRGPQGTLFGAASLGGAVNYIARRPDLDRFEAAAEAVGSGTDGGGYNQAYRLMLNAPLAEGRLAVRAAGTWRRDAGFIDNIGTRVDDANATTVWGGRVTVDWAPAPGTKLSLLSLYQRTDTRDSPWVNPDLPDLTKSTLTSEPSNNSVWIESLRLDQDLGFGSLTAIGSYHHKHAYIGTDLQRFSAFGFDHPSLEDLSTAEGGTFEVRLNSRRDQPLQWLVGAMYDSTHIRLPEYVRAPNGAAVADAFFGPGAGALMTDGDVWGLTDVRFKGKEMAVFGEASYTFAERLKLSAGGRLFKTESTADTYGFGLLYAAFINGQVVSDPPAASQSETGFNPKFSVSYDITPTAQVYALASKGFRFGGPSINPDPSLPPAYKSDTLWNYELGVKSDWLDHRLRLDASVFHIDWSDIQLPVVTPQGTTGIINAGDARIDGVEGSIGWRDGGLSLESSLTWLDARLTSISSPLATAAPGARLPGASRWLLSNTVRYQWEGPLQPFVLAAHRYASEAPAYLQSFPLRTPSIGGYDLFDLRGGVTVGKVEVAAFVTNLTNERAVMSAYYTGSFGNQQQDYIAQPRTIGLSLDWKY